MHATTSDGLSTDKASELQKIHGFNEIAARQEPEWKKVIKRYLDPVSLTIVSPYSSSLLRECMCRSSGRDGRTSRHAHSVGRSLVYGGSIDVRSS